MDPLDKPNGDNEVVDKDGEVEEKEEMENTQNDQGVVGDNELTGHSHHDKGK